MNILKAPLLLVYALYLFLDYLFQKVKSATCSLRNLTTSLVLTYQAGIPLSYDLRDQQNLSGLANYCTWPTDF